MTIVRFILGLAACCLAGQSQAQWTSDAWTFTDPARDDRPIPVNFLRPDGDPEPLPWVIVAHGFVMGPDDYDDLATALVEQGFLVGLVDTETGFALPHEDYAKDLVYLAEQGAQALADADAPLAAWIQGNVGLVDTAWVVALLGSPQAWPRSRQLSVWHLPKPTPLPSPPADKSRHPRWSFQARPTP